MIEFKEDKEIQVSYNGKKLKRFEADCSQGKQSRLVFIGEEVVVKIDHRPSTDRTTRQTAKEIELWETIEPQDRKFFAEVLEYGRTPSGFYYIVQKKYNPTRFLSNMRYTLLRITEKYKIVDIWLDESYAFDYDWYFENWFPNGERPVIIDWGM